MSDQRFNHAVVRLLADDPNHKHPMGAGFLATPIHVLTCAHVVADILRIRRDTSERPQAPLTLDFPLLDGQPRIQAQVAVWHPLKAGAVMGDIEDIAVLTLSPDSVPPPGAASISIAKAAIENIFDHRVQIFGFPKSFEQGKYVNGRLQGLTGHGWVEIKHEFMGGLVEGGFSGAPVWDADSQTVLGMITSTIAVNQEKSAYMIPAATLAMVLQAIHPLGDCPSQPYPLPKIADLIRPGGAIDVDSPFYIERRADAVVMQEVQRPRSVVCVRGPRQTGKTSLIYRMLMSCRQGEMDLRTVFIDFQALSPSKLERLEILWQTITAALNDQLNLQSDPSGQWQTGANIDRNMSIFLADQVFRRRDAPVLICLDEVDRVFAFPVKTGFFASVRSFYNQGAFDPCWKKIHWLLSSSSEPSFFIDDLSQSPFNIGETVTLNVFTPDETAEFAERCGLIWDNAMIARVMEYTGGQPYLVHLLLYHTVRRGGAVEGFLDAQTAGNEIFRDHLNRFLKRFQKEPRLARAMRNVLKGRGCRDVDCAERLEAAGLARRNRKGEVSCCCGLYRQFFDKEL